MDFLMKKITLCNPNDNEVERRLRFWTSFLEWLLGTPEGIGLVDKEYVGTNFYGHPIVNIDWEPIYRLEFGKEAPFSILMGNQPTWEEIIENIELVYKKIIKDESKFAYEMQINILLNKFAVSNTMLDGRIMEKTNLENSELVNETKHWLSKYPKANEAYTSALEKLREKKYERNVLDDMRLALEILVKDIMKNDKSLENQISDLGTKLKEAGISKEISNSFIKLIDYYTKYQNDHVKHDSKIDNRE